MNDCSTARRAINPGNEESKSKATKNGDINVKYVSEKERTGERRVDAVILPLLP